MKKKYIIGILVFSALVLGVVSIMYMPRKASSGNEDMVPTVFMHGYKGTENSFGHMLKRFEQYKWGHKSLVYIVSAEGKLRVYNLDKGQKTPAMIQVVFENNRASFQDNAVWLADVLADLKASYGVNSINLVGHSMGGIVSLKYIQEFQDPGTYPAVNKLVAIGSPFDGIYSREYFRIHQDAGAVDLMPDSRALNHLWENRHVFPAYTSVLSIGSKGDVVAVPRSVKTLSRMIPEEQLREIMISDDALGHSALHEDDRVDQYIRTFLWQNNVR